MRKYLKNKNLNNLISVFFNIYFKLRYYQRNRKIKLLTNFSLNFGKNLERNEIDALEIQSKLKIRKKVLRPTTTETSKLHHYTQNSPLKKLISTAV